jgi:hypothetical protein
MRAAPQTPISQGRPCCEIRGEIFEPRVDQHLIEYSGQQHQAP